MYTANRDKLGDKLKCLYFKVRHTPLTYTRILIFIELNRIIKTEVKSSCNFKKIVVNS